MSKERRFPLFLLKIEDEAHFLNYWQAVRAFHAHLATHVAFGEYVLRRDLSVRKMTAEDQRRITEAIYHRRRPKNKQPSSPSPAPR